MFCSSDPSLNGVQGSKSVGASSFGLMVPKHGIELLRQLRASEVKRESSLELHHILNLVGPRSVLETVRGHPGLHVRTALGEGILGCGHGGNLQAATDGRGSCEDLALDGGNTVRHGDGRRKPAEKEKLGPFYMSRQSRGTVSWRLTHGTDLYSHSSLAIASTKGGQDHSTQHGFCYESEPVANPLQHLLPRMPFSRPAPGCRLRRRRLKLRVDNGAPSSLRRYIAGHQATQPIALSATIKAESGARSCVRHACLYILIKSTHRSKCRACRHCRATSEQQGAPRR